MSASLDPSLTLTERAFLGERGYDVGLRHEIAQRLADVISWPSTRIAPHERYLAGDVLATLLRNAPLPLRERCAMRLSQVVDGPKSVLRYLAQDEISVAAPLLDQCPSLDESDLVAIIQVTTPSHWLAIARRRNIGEPVTDALVKTGDPNAIEAALRNAMTRFSVDGLDRVVQLAPIAPRLAPALMKREELKPPQALTLFWCADAATRLAILKRFGVDRTILVSQLGDLFVRAAASGAADPDSQKALQFIERRQRNREAQADSPFGTMEGMVEARLADGFDDEDVLEFGRMANIRPDAALRVLRDAGGEPVAVLCKAVGIKRDGFIKLWRALGRAIEAQADAPFARALQAFEVLSNAKAQTILRYWNWSAGLELSPPVAVLYAEDGEPTPIARAIETEWRL